MSNKVKCSECKYFSDESWDGWESYMCKNLKTVTNFSYSVYTIGGNPIYRECEKANPNYDCEYFEQREPTISWFKRIFGFSPKEKLKNEKNDVCSKQTNKTVGDILADKEKS